MPGFLLPKISDSLAAQRSRARIWSGVTAGHCVFIGSSIEIFSVATGQADFQQCRFGLYSGLPIIAEKRDL